MPHLEISRQFYYILLCATIFKVRLST